LPTSCAKDEVEKAKQGIEHLQIVPERAACVGSGAEKAGEVMTFVDPMVTSLINFGVKRDTVLHRLVFVMDAVQTIAEVGSPSPADSAISHSNGLF